MKKIIFIILSIFFLFLFTKCREWNNPYDDFALFTQNPSGTSEILPSVTTSTVTDINNSTATGGGNVTDDGGATVTAKGVCWSTSQSPTISNDYTTNGSGTGSFTSNIDNLTDNTTYYVRAYATNSEGTSYGNLQNFTTIAGSNLIEYSNITLQYISTSLYNNMMLITSDGTTADGNSTNGDIALIWQSTYGYSLCSPDAEWITELYSWNGITYTTDDKKHTKIMLLSSANFDDINADYLEELNITEQTVAGGGVGVTDLYVSDIVAFETNTGKKGVLQVVTNSKLTKNMTMDIKISN